MDVTGAAHLFGGEAALLAEAERRLAAQGFSARGALAPGPALAGSLARFSGAARVSAEASPEEIEAIAARLPVAALRLDETARRRMERAGLRTLGDLLSRPRAPLAARFGPEVMARLDAVAGRRREPISPRFEAPDFMAERRFPEGLTRREDIERTLAILARELCLLLERHGAGARHVAADFYRVDGAVAHIETGTSRPLRDPELDRPAAARAPRQSRRGGARHGLWLRRDPARRRRGPSSARRRRPISASLPRRRAWALTLSDLVDRLGARLGLRRVLRLYPQASHIPELAVAALPAGRRAAAGRARAAAAPAPARPLRLLEHPEPIEAVASMPDGPPLRFRWRRTLHELAAYEGPERIAPQWWSAPQDEETRDYFYVEDREGLRFWLFRKGLPGHGGAYPRWFMHGLF